MSNVEPDAESIPAAISGTTSEPIAEPLIRYEEPAAGVARIVLARPAQRNAQNRSMLYQLNDAFDRAAQNDAIKVIILAADGPHFSSGHDLRDDASMSEFMPVSCWGGFDLPGAEGWLATEEEIYVGLCWRWRNLPKPTLAAVQGRVIAGGLMLVWPCDLIIAASDAVFSDPVVAFGVNSHEYFVHPWEVGARRAKQMLFLGDDMTAEEAHRLGMVMEVVEPAELEARTLAVAERIATRPMMGLKLAKMSVNQALDSQGQWSAIQSAFSLHQLGHAHNRERFGIPIDPSGAAVIRSDSAR